MGVWGFGEFGRYGELVENDEVKGGMGVMTLATTGTMVDANRNRLGVRTETQQPIAAVCRSI